MARRGERDRGKERFWRRMLRAWQGSGRTVRDFCGERGLAEPSFYAWRRTLAERAHAARPKPRLAGAAGLGPAVFVPVHVTATASLEVVLNRGRVVRVPAGFDPATLRRLLAVLEEGPSC